MAIYKIFLNRGASLYSGLPNMNTGGDEILDVGYSKNTDVPGEIRSVIDYPETVMNEALGLIPAGTSYEVELNLYLAQASNLTSEFEVDIHPLSQDWTSGNGKFGDIPVNNSGATWDDRAPSLPWTNPGGIWYPTAYNVKQSFEKGSILDLRANVTPIITDIQNNVISKNGFIVKLHSQYEEKPELKYFSPNTNSIYPPHLTVKWDDRVYEPPVEFKALETYQVEVNLINNKGVYVENEIERFYLNVRPRFPQREFSTESLYLQKYVLPENTLWGIKDEGTEEMVVPFDENYTKVSCDSSGSYFELFMNGLQPERYYRLLLKTEINGSVKVIDNRNIFKVTRYVH